MLSMRPPFVLFDTGGRLIFSIAAGLRLWESRIDENNLC